MERMGALIAAWSDEWWFWIAFALVSWALIWIMDWDNRRIERRDNEWVERAIRRHEHEMH